MYKKSKIKLILLTCVLIIFLYIGDYLITQILDILMKVTNKNSIIVFFDNIYYICYLTKDFIITPIYNLVVIVIFKYYDIINRKILLLILYLINYMYILGQNSLQGLQSIIDFIKYNSIGEDFPVCMIKLIISSLIISIGFALVPKYND